MFKQTSQSKDVQTQNINKRSNKDHQYNKDITGKYSVSGANR